MPDSNRTYSEKEIAALLERTAQLQAEEAESADKSREGLNLTELELIARDAGLDPQFLHRAAIELEHAGGKPLGKNKTKTHIRVDRILPSNLNDEEWEEVVFALKRRFESDSYDMGLGLGTLGQGKIEQIGRSREWRHTSMSGVQTTVLLRPHKKGTNMELSQRVGMSSTKVESWAYGLPFAMLFAVIMGAVLKSALIGSAAMVGWTALLVPLVYYLDSRWRDKKHNQLVELADELQEIVMRDNVEEALSEIDRQTTQAPRESIREATPEGRLDWSPEEEQESDGEVDRTRSRER